MEVDTWKPYTAAMEAYHRGKRDAVIVVYDDFERDEVPVSYFFREPAEFPAYEWQALDLCVGRVLDVGAGSGCHALVLQERGLEVTAIDIDQSMVRILRDRGVRDARVATWMDIEAEPFDTVLMMMNGMGLTETLSGLRQFFAEARRLVRKGGQVLADSTDVRARLDPESGRTGALERADGRYVGELHFQVEYEGRKGAPFPQLYVDPNTLIRYAREQEWGCQIVRDPDEYGHYLARLTP